MIDGNIVFFLLLGNCINWVDVYVLRFFVLMVGVCGIVEIVIQVVVRVNFVVVKEIIVMDFDMGEECFY